MDGEIAAVRRFNRFYTGELGLLDKALLRSDFSLVEGRLLYEIATAEAASAATLGRRLGIDPGYLSRLLKALQRAGLIERRLAESDRRQRVLALTDAGEAAFAELDRRSAAAVGRQLEALDGAGRAELIDAMRRIERLLGGADMPRTIELRAHRPGDLGWIVERHAVLYAAEHGWDSGFEALVARIAADFLEGFDERRERAWIAELDGRRVGSVLLVAADETTAKLRLLLVEPEARGLGLGRRLVESCLGFARTAGYRRVTLWTNDVLTAARRLYEAAGFRLESEAPHHSFGVDLVGQNWVKQLSQVPGGGPPSGEPRSIRYLS